MVDFAVTAFVSILFLVDPPGTVPAFLALTANYTPARRRRTAFVAALAATLTMMGFALVGNALFRALNLTLPAFQIAGGIILFLVALDMIRSETGTAEHQPSEVEASATTGEVAITPLAVPLLAGPAALSTVAVLMARADGVFQMASVFAAIAVTGLLCFVTFRLADPIQRRLGVTGIHVLGRILGLVLAGIAVQFVLDGLAAAGIIPKK
ncbi:MAG: MarC family protein [Gemmataceae bacterium]|nr:MarC family protein [Gemmataceae bacterium]